MKTLALIALILLPYSASADTPMADYQASYDNCLSRTQPINNAAVYACADSTSELVKKEINHLYGKIYERLLKESPEDASKLELTQKSWLTYRKLQCELAGSYIGSPMFSVCPMYINIQRAQELRELSPE